MSFFRFHRVGTLNIFNSPLYVHASVFIVVGVVALFAIESPTMALVAVSSYIAIIFLHEIGHAYVAKRLGLDVFRIDIGWIHGRCHYESSEFEWHEVLVSWGGVLAQLAVGIPVLAIGAIGILDSWKFFGPVLVFLGYINLLVAAFNALPTPGLDGAMMWRIVPLWLARRKQGKKKKPAKRSLKVVPRDK